jgi:hypothetical protein
VQSYQHSSIFIRQIVLFYSSGFRKYNARFDFFSDSNLAALNCFQYFFHGYSSIFGYLIQFLPAKRISEYKIPLPTCNTSFYYTSLPDMPLCNCKIRKFSLLGLVCNILAILGSDGYLLHS